MFHNNTLYRNSLSLIAGDVTSTIICVVSQSLTMETNKKYACIATNQPNAKSNHDPNPSTIQHTIVYIPLNIVVCPIYPETLVRGNVIAPFSLGSVVIVLFPICLQKYAGNKHDYSVR